MHRKDPRRTNRQSTTILLVCFLISLARERGGRDHRLYPVLFFKAEPLLAPQQSASWIFKPVTTKSAQRDRAKGKSDGPPGQRKLRVVLRSRRRSPLHETDHSPLIRESKWGSMCDQPLTQIEQELQQNHHLSKIQ